MIPGPRRRFNERFTPALYAAFLDRLAAKCGEAVPFRVCETPCFLPADLLARMTACGEELLAQLDPTYLAASDAALPAAYAVPNQAPHPLFVQADFGLVRGADGALEPKLVEIQGFPSLYAFQPAVAKTYIESYGIELAPSPGYEELFRQAVLGRHAPEETILMEIDPAHQKTRPDFVLTGKMLGVRAVCVTKIRKRGSRLYYDRDGVETPVRRIYNRTIVDELERKGITPPFDWRDELDVEWAGHPNWYFRLSKFTIPHLKHECVPETWFLDRLAEIPPDPENYVLKPLYSFAGRGVIVGPTRGEIEAVPADRRADYVLQRRMRFEPVIDTPHGPTQAEIRIMYIRIDKPVAVSTLVRMGRGKMMGVDHNRDLEWVGASAGLVA